MPKAKTQPILDFESLKQYCLSRPDATLDYPFGPEVAVFRVAGKMFALCLWDQLPLRVNLKCEPKLAELLREEYEAVEPGWHMNKRHWNTVTAGHDLPDGLLRDQIDRSHALIVASLPKKVRQSLGPEPKQAAARVP